MLLLDGRVRLIFAAYAHSRRIAHGRNFDVSQVYVERTELLLVESDNKFRRAWPRPCGENKILSCLMVTKVTCELKV